MRLTYQLLIFFLAITVLSNSLPDRSESPTATIHREPVETIVRDVAIVGGGSTGCYAAISLIDKSKSVIVIEAKSRLGGHTETYRDPVTGVPINLGVLVWHNLPIVQSYLRRFNISLLNTNSLPRGDSATKYVTMATGKLATGYVPPSAQEIGAALQRYTEQISKYPYLESQGFVFPDPIPKDFLIPFKEFVGKYRLGPIVHLVFQYGQGIGDVLNLPTIYILKIFGADLVRNLQTGFLVTATGDMSALYEAITKELVKLNSVLFDTTVQYAERDLSKEDEDGYQYITVTTKTTTPNGQTKQKRTIIKAKQLLITIPPTLSSLSPYFNLDKTEKSIFSKFKYTSYLTGLLNNTGIPNAVELENIDPERDYGIPKLPGVYNFYQSLIPGIIQFKYGSSEPVTETYVKKDIKTTLDRLRKNGIISKTKGEPGFTVLKNHTPFHFTVDKKEIAKGFYRDLYALQGKRGTWWTGGAWHVQDSSLLWLFTENVVGRLVGELC